jgi:hypothetical protein
MFQIYLHFFGHGFDGLTRIKDNYFVFSEAKILQTACGGTTGRYTEMHAYYVLLSPKAKGFISLSVCIRVNPCPKLFSKIIKYLPANFRFGSKI